MGLYADLDRHGAHDLHAQQVAPRQPDPHTVFQANSAAAAAVVNAKAQGYSVLGNPRPAVLYVAQHQISEGTSSLAALIDDISKQIKQYGSLSDSNDVVSNTRNDMYLTSEALRLLAKDKRAADLSSDDIGKLNAYKQSLDNSTKFIPPWSPRSRWR